MAVRVKKKRTPKPHVRKTTCNGWIVWVPPEFEKVDVTPESIRTTIITVQSRGRERSANIAWTGSAYRLTDIATGLLISRTARGRWEDEHETLLDALREAARWTITAQPPDSCPHGDDPLTCPKCYKPKGGW